MNDIDKLSILIDKLEDDISDLKEIILKSTENNKFCYFCKYYKNNDCVIEDSFSPDEIDYNALKSWVKITDTCQYWKEDKYG